MKQKNIIVKKNCFLVNNHEYGFDQSNEINSILGLNIKIIIEEEELYSKKFFTKLKRNKLESFVENKIDNEFQINKDILYDYEQNKKKNLVAIYSLKGGKRIEKIIDDPKKLEVKPMQFIIKSFAEKIIGRKVSNSKILVELDGYYYYVSLKDGLFFYGFVEKEKNIIVNRILETEDSGDIYIDDKIIDKINFLERFKSIKIRLGDLIYEKLYKKQKFYFRKVLQ